MVKLVNNFGEWTFGQEVAPQPGDGGGAFYYVKLHGLDVDNQGPVPCARQLQIDQGGYLWAKTLDGLWFAWINGMWWANGRNTIGPVTTSYPNIPPINPPYPISADGSMLRTSSGSLTTAEGIWTIDDSGNANLNGIPLRNGVGFATVGVTHLQNNAHGQMFLELSSDSTWWIHTGNRLNPSTGPVSGPVPIGITVDRSGIATGVGIPHGSSLGTAMAVITVVLSDGSAFTGSISVSLDSQGFQSGTMSGNNLVYNHAYGSPTAAFMTITATQNGAQYIQYFDEQFT
jgi:hypothetical protein